VEAQQVVSQIEMFVDGIVTQHLLRQQCTRSNNDRGESAKQRGFGGQIHCYRRMEEWDVSSEV